MLGARIDRLAAAHPAFKRYAEERINIFFGTSLHVNINICITAGISAGLLVHSSNTVLRYGAVIAMLIVWLYASVLAGFLKQWLFIFFETVYFVLPQLLIIPDSGETMRKTQYFISDIAEALWADTLELLFPYFGYSTASYIYLGIYIVTFFIGLKLRSAAKHSELYCRARLEQLQ